MHHCAVPLTYVVLDEVAPVAPETIVRSDLEGSIFIVPLKSARSRREGTRTARPRVRSGRRGADLAVAVAGATLFLPAPPTFGLDLVSRWASTPWTFGSCFSKTGEVGVSPRGVPILWWYVCLGTYDATGVSTRFAGAISSSERKCLATAASFSRV